ncbi:MAG: hypothetical protein JSS71_00845 [Armatimonadetes bacterium]|nr:hypothetical protein [Armatimonadota bacterium]MBX3109111.1 hypothetical protein [Fimbriimonadaceae bacterium]
MLRKPYTTLRQAGFMAPEPLPSPVVLGIFDIGQVPDAEIWMRLLERQFPNLGWRILSFGVDLELALAPSRFRRAVPGRADWGQPREFAYCVSGGLLMAGPPTEEAWEEFEAAVSRLGRAS